MLAGGIATFFTGGAAAPWMAALAGAGTGALTGDKKLPLWERLGMGALGGYGGGSLFSALGSAGTSAAGTEAATEAAKQAATNAAANGASTVGSQVADAAAASGTDLASEVPGISMGALDQAGAQSANVLPDWLSNAAGAQTGGATSVLPDSLGSTASAQQLAAQPWANLPAGQSPVMALPDISPSGNVVGQMISTPSGIGAPISNAQLAAKGLPALTNKAGQEAFMNSLKGTTFGAKGVLGASLAPIMMQPQQNSTGVEQQKPWYYTAAPGQNSLYNPGVINPNIAKLGYLPQGQSAFIGQQWNPGQYTQQYPGIPASQNPAGTIGAKAGGLMSLRHFDQGGSTSPAPSMSNALSGMNDYYKNMLNSSTTQGPMTPTITTPSPDAMNAYLARSTQMVTPQSQSQPTVADVTPPPTTAPGGVPPGIDMSKIQQYLSGRGGMGGMGGTYPTYTYDPATGQYTQTGGGMEGRLGGFHMAQGGLTPNYAAGGKLLHGHGDGMSDDIPAVITGQKPQRAALADGEFVVPADVVSHLGNGSTNAGAKRLYAMMDKVRQARTGNPKQGRQINPNRFMPA